MDRSRGRHISQCLLRAWKELQSQGMLMYWPLVWRCFEGWPSHFRGQISQSQGQVGFRYVYFLLSFKRISPSIQTDSMHSLHLTTSRCFQLSSHAWFQVCENHTSGTTAVSQNEQTLFFGLEHIWTKLSCVHVWLKIYHNIQNTRIYSTSSKLSIRNATRTKLPSSKL